MRERSGIFDVSHMGEIETEGPEALELLQRLLSNDVSKIAVGGAQYSCLCREDGGVLDDLFTYRLAEERYLTVTNASNHERDFEWFAAHSGSSTPRFATLRTSTPCWRCRAPTPARPSSRRLASSCRRGCTSSRSASARSGAGLRHRLHRRGRCRADHRPGRRPRRLGSPHRPRRDARRPRRPRHAAARGLLSPLRKRPLRGPQPDRGRPGLVLQGGDGLRRLRRRCRRARGGAGREAGAVRAHRPGDPPPGQPRAGRRRAVRRGDQRHAVTVPRGRDRHGLCARRPGRARHRAGDRRPRQPAAGAGQGEAAV